MNSEYLALQCTSSVQVVQVVQYPFSDLWHELGPGEIRNYGRNRTLSRVSAEIGFKLYFYSWLVADFQ